jgi:tetratricopeptide (TPR) repeat protein
MAAAASVLAVAAVLAGLYLWQNRASSRATSHPLRATTAPRSAQPPSEAPDAETLYNQGRDAWNDRSEVGFYRALQRFEEAVSKEPDHARAYSGIADTYSLLAYYGFLAPRVAEFRAREAVQKALSIDPNLVEARTSLAWIRMAFEWDWPAAEHQFKIATAHQPAYATAYQWYSLYLMTRGRTQASLSAIKKAESLEPLARVIAKSAGQRHFHAGNYSLAIAEYLEVLRAEPTSSLTRYWLALAYEQQALASQRAGQRARAKAQFQKALVEFQKAHKYSRGQPAPAILAGIGHLYAVSGTPAEARKKLQELQALKQQRYVSPVALATVYTGLGARDQALAHLEEARRVRATELILLKIEPRFDPLREEERFIRLVESIWPE